jgi:hypothetical protein
MTGSLQTRSVVRSGGTRKELRNAPKHAYDDARHGDLRAAITAELTRVMSEAYAALGITNFPTPP